MDSITKITREKLSHDRKLQTGMGNLHLNAFSNTGCVGPGTFSTCIAQYCHYS
jgi:hypothetical protein